MKANLMMITALTLSAQIFATPAQAVGRGNSTRRVIVCDTPSGVHLELILRHRYVADVTLENSYYLKLTQGERSLGTYHRDAETGAEGIFERLGSCLPGDLANSVEVHFGEHRIRYATPEGEREETLVNCDA